jgi:hypothetical protein
VTRPLSDTCIIASKQLLSVKGKLVKLRDSYKLAKERALC